MVWWEVGRINYYQFDLTHTHTKYLGAAGIVLNFYYIHILLAYLPYLLL